MNEVTDKWNMLGFLESIPDEDKDGLAQAYEDLLHVLLEAENSYAAESAMFAVIKQLYINKITPSDYDMTELVTEMVEKSQHYQDIHCSWIAYDPDEEFAKDFVTNKIQERNQ